MISKDNCEDKFVADGEQATDPTLRLRIARTAEDSITWKHQNMSYEEVRECCAIMLNVLRRERPNDTWEPADNAFICMAYDPATGGVQFSMVGLAWQKAASMLEDVHFSCNLLMFQDELKEISHGK